MKKVVVRYKTRPDRAAENEKLIQDVFAKLAESKPDGLHYAAFKFPDGVSFMHVATVEANGGVDPLTSLPVFQAFTAGIKERCEEPPVSTAVEIVGSYRAF